MTISPTMKNDKTALAVAALRDGTVIDHIPSANLFKAVKILDLEKCGLRMTIGNNLPSRKLGSKGIIKIDGLELPESTINRIALIAPHAKVNVIRDFEVVEKRNVSLPDRIVGLVRCPNPKCITNNEPMSTRFDVVDHDDVTLRCCYCGQDIAAGDATIM